MGSSSGADLLLEKRFLCSDVLEERFLLSDGLEERFLPMVSPTSGQGMPRDSEHHFLQQFMVFVFQGMSGPAL